jgi:branched-chain amino acid aminotransferase
LSLTEFYNANEVFACGTMGELTPLYEIDGREIENIQGESIIEILWESFHKLIPEYCEKLP